MAIRKTKETDEVGQRKFARDSKGRFAAKPIKPLPVHMRAEISKWEDEENTINSTFVNFKKIQSKLNPKKECKDLFEEVHNFLVVSGGMISKVLNKDSNKPYGFLVRIPSSTNPDVVFMRFVKFNPYNTNTYFQKTNAIVSTLICGERWLEKRNKRGEWIDNIPFEVFYNTTKRFMIIEDGITVVNQNIPITYVNGRNINCCEHEGYVINEEMMEYFNRFEQKAKEYYKNNGKNKKFIALPFT